MPIHPILKQNRAKRHSSHAQQPAKSVGIRPLAPLCTLFSAYTPPSAHALHRLPPSEEGEWWELSDESRGGLPYYYQTKTGETKWERPSGFVIPLGILQVRREALTSTFHAFRSAISIPYTDHILAQNTAVGRRLSQTTFDHFSKLIPTTQKVRTLIFDSTSCKIDVHHQGPPICTNN